MKYLLDTNILLRLVELAHAQHKEASQHLKLCADKIAFFTFSCKTFQNSGMSAHARSIKTV